MTGKADLSVANAPAPNVLTFPDSPFKLHQPFEPACDQPTAIAGLVEGIDDGLMYQTLLGSAPVRTGFVT